MLTNLAAGTLKRNMPVESSPATSPTAAKSLTWRRSDGCSRASRRGWKRRSTPVPSATCSSATPGWRARRSAPARDPQSPDFLNFHEGSQPLVDCGFLAQALLRAPNELWKKLDAATQKNLAAGLLSARVITPGQNNWLLFAATVRGRARHDGRDAGTRMRIDYAVRAHQQWYVGDGLYGDGPRFHWDYYNSFVIQPMLLDVLRNIAPHAKTWQPLLPDILARAKRYAAIQERLISPEGTFPVIGRSICYRTGAFQLLAQMALLGELPAPLTGARVRAALDRGDEAPAGSAGHVRRQGLADRRLLRPSAAPGRELHFDRQSVSVRRGVSAAGIAARRSVLERAGGRLDVAAHVGAAKTRPRTTRSRREDADHAIT